MASSTRDVWLDLSHAHVEQVMCTGCGSVTAAMDALQAYLGWPPQLAARALLGCPAAPAVVALLTDSSAARPEKGLREQCSRELPEAALTWRATSLCVARGGGWMECPFGPASLPHAHPAQMAQLAAWLG